MNQKDRTEIEKKTFHAAETFNGRTEQLKEYLRRLGAGEALESVRAGSGRAQSGGMPG